MYVTPADCNACNCIHFITCDNTIIHILPDLVIKIYRNKKDHLSIKFNNKPPKDRTVSMFARIPLFSSLTFCVIKLPSPGDQ